MKRLLFAVIGVLILVTIVAVGCVVEDGVGPTPDEGEGVVSSCVTCHSDKDLLKQTVTTVEEEKSEETSGEG
jgi:hypothetical protein